jgi:hypothetical protein
MPEAILRRYWDSSPFLDWIKDDPQHADTCDKIIGDAREGRCIILTSAVTLAEVTKRRRGPLAVEPETEATITGFFKNDYIVIVPADRVVTERARRLIWDFPYLKARDAIHIATAILAEAHVIEAYDEDFLRVGEAQRPGYPLIREPKWTGQDSFTFTPVPTTPPVPVFLPDAAGTRPTTPVVVPLPAPPLPPPAPI